MSIPKITPYTMPEMDSGLNKASWQPDASRTVLLIHDMQKYFINFYDTSAEPVTTLVKNIRRIKEQCKAAGIPVIYTAQPGDQNPADRALLTDFWGTGLKADPNLTDIVDSLAPEADDHVLTKWRYSAFKRNGLKELLKEMGRDQMIVCGVYAHIGCLLSCADAFMFDIQPILVADAVADFSRADHIMALNYAARNCAMVRTTHQVISLFETAIHKPRHQLPGSLEDLKRLLGEPLGLESDDINDHDSLIDLGLDSIRVMIFLEQWRKAGCYLELVELAENPTVADWWQLLSTRREVV